MYKLSFYFSSANFQIGTRNGDYRDWGYILRVSNRFFSFTIYWLLY